MLLSLRVLGCVHAREVVKQKRVGQTGGAINGYDDEKIDARQQQIERRSQDKQRSQEQRQRRRSQEQRSEEHRRSEVDGGAQEQIIDYAQEDRRRGSRAQQHGQARRTEDRSIARLERA